MSKGKNATASPAPSGTPATPLDLKALREERGLTLDYIFQRTRISITNLQAIEELDFASLPPPIYTRAFIKQYAAVVGIEPGEILARYEGQRNAVSQLPASESPALLSTSERRKIDYRLLVLVAVVLLIVLAIVLVSRARRGEMEPHAVPLTSAAPSSVPAAPPSSPTPAPALRGADTPGTTLPPASAVPATVTSTPGALKPAVPLPSAAATTRAARPLRLVITARERAWIGIRPEHGPSFQATLKPGQTLSRDVPGPFVLDVGNAGGVDVMLEGKPMGTLGNSGDVAHVKLP